MKKRSSYFLVCVLSFVFSWGVGGICFADNAAEVVLQVSYPSGSKGYVYFYNGGLNAIDESKSDYYVNVHLTLLDENGLPATAGPAGEDLSGVTATLTTQLGVASSIVEDQFLSDSAELTFDVVEVGPAARAHVRYACQTGCEPGRDTLEVTVDSLTASAEVEVRAPVAASLVIRTLNVPGARPTDLFEDLSVSPYTQSHNAGVAELAGEEIYFEVWAVETNGDFTTAPELDGQQVTVTAYADYDASGKVGDMASPALEDIALATATAEFSGGAATGNITIEKAGVKDNDGSAQLKVVLTAELGSVSTTKITADPATTDSTLDWVGMRPLIKNQLIIGRDPSGVGNLIEEVDYWYVLDDETQYSGGSPRTNQMAVFVADSYGNPVTGEMATVSSEISDSLLAVGVTDKANGWNIANNVRSNANNDGLAIPWNNVRNEDVPKGGGPIRGTITLQDDGLLLEEDTATVYLVRAGSGNYDPAHPHTGANFLDLHLDTDYAGTSLRAGETVTIYLTDVNGSAGRPTSQDIIEVGDKVTLYANKYNWFFSYYAGTAYLISGVGQSYDNATTTGYNHTITSSNVGSKGEITIPVKIWGPCSQTETSERVIVSIADIKKGIGSFPDPVFGSLWLYDTDGPNDYYGPAAPQYDLENRWITDLKPDGETKVKISELANWVFAENDDLDADPIVITSQFMVGVNNFLTPDSVDTADDYGNVYNDAPSYGINSDVGSAFVYPTRGASITFDYDDVGETGTVTVDVAGLGARQFLITNIAGSTVAGALMCTLEGPAEPIPGGEAIIQVMADRTFTPTPRNVQVSIDEDNSVEDSELRDFSGVALTSPTTQGLESDSMVRLVVSAPEAGDVVIQVGDASGASQLLDTGTCTITFGAACTAVVSIDPESAELLVGQTKQFTAATECEEEGQEPDDPVYNWEIMDMGSTGCTGSAIDNNGLYEAPESGDCTDTIKVTDNANGDASATAQVVVSDCVPSASITPCDVTLKVGVTQQFCATTTCNGDSIEGIYTWTIAGGSAGTLSGDCIVYTAGSTDGVYELSVLDTKNGVSTSCTITIEPPMGIEVSPDPMLRSRWIGLWHLMTIRRGANTSFASFGTTVSFDPDSAVFELPPLVLGPEEIWQLVQVNPPWIAGTEEDQTVTVTVTTDGEEVTGAFQVEMLPSPLDE